MTQQPELTPALVGVNSHAPPPTAGMGSTSFIARRGRPFAVTLTGEIDLTAEAELRSLLGQFQARGTAVATVDLRAVTFIGSTGLAFLSGLLEIAQERGGTVTLIGASAFNLRTLALVGFFTTFQLAL